MIYDKYHDTGKNNINSTRSDFIDMIGEEGIKDIIRNVFLGGNVRDTTEFITQRRLMNSYAAAYDLFINYLSDETSNPSDFIELICNELNRSSGNSKKTFYLWLLGLTKKGFDNIVRTPEHLNDYQNSFSSSVSETTADLTERFGALSGCFRLGEKEIQIDWKFITLLSLFIGSQTLTIRGSSKSMNGKLFERLLLGTLLTIMGFDFCATPPKSFQNGDKLFWLSNMDENERETDATLIYNGIAISIDIGFIGKGNSEISLDKVTRFNRYKEIAGISHTMKTVIIVDTVAEKSDLLNKAARVGGIVLQMIRSDWIMLFAKEICSIFGLDHPLQHKNINELDPYLQSQMQNMDIRKFIPNKIKRMN